MISRREWQAIDRLLRAATRRARVASRNVSRFVLGKTTHVDGDVARSRGTCLANEAFDDLETMQNYAFASIPLNGAEGIHLSVLGRRSHGVVIGLDDRRYRPTLDPGEAAVYNNAGAKILMKKDGSIEISPAPGQKVKVAGGTQKIARADRVEARWTSLKATLDAFVPPGQDGGAALSVAISTAIAAMLATGADRGDIE